MPISSTTGRTTQSIKPPEYEQVEYTVPEAIKKFLDEKVKDIAKALGYTSFWVGQALPSPGLKNFGTTMGDFKNFVSATELPKKSLEVKKAFSDLLSNATSHNASEALNKSATWINTAVDSIDFGSRFVPINSAVMRGLKGTSFAATLASSTNGVREQVGKISNTSSDKLFHGISLARDVSYGVLGAYGLGCIVTGATIMPIVMITCLTSGLTWTITSYFYEKIYDPEHKGKNLNPDAWLRNEQLKIKHTQSLATP